MKFHRVLFPTDFSERSRAIAPHVRAVCRHFHAPLTILHTVYIPALAYGAPEAIVSFDYPLEDIRKQAEQAIRQEAQFFPELEVETMVKEGDPGESIEATVKERAIDLIMMPTRGHGKFRATLLGSVTAKALHDAPCAIWTATHGEAPQVRHTEWNMVVCAIDTNCEGRQLIAAAARLAKTPAGVRLVHAIPPYEMAAERFGNSEFTQALKEDARRSIAGMQQELGTEFPVTVGEGKVADVIRGVARNHEADLVVIGRGVLPRFAGVLRSHAYSIVRSMPCPVLSLRMAGEQKVRADRA